MHLHLDMVGGMAGDMFIAAMLDAFPEKKAPLWAMLQQLPFFEQLDIALQDVVDKGLSGNNFSVIEKSIDSRLHYHGHHHEHRSWLQIKHMIAELPGNAKINNIAAEIFLLLANAEAKIHHKSLDDVHFHEVGAWDCIVDILSAAFLIDSCHVTSSSFSSIPWGGGVVVCQHGTIPVPAPATLLLLEGFSFHQDDINGERVTPTGAAILAWLKRLETKINGSLSRSGYGFGTKRFADLANMLRVSLLDTQSTSSSVLKQTCLVVECDIDDMSSELLAIACDVLRQSEAVIDLTLSTHYGKKSRLVTRLHLLCHKSSLNHISDLIFSQTTSIGLRYWAVERHCLQRQLDHVVVEDKMWAIKRVFRPNSQVTVKVEADTLKTMTDSYHQRQLIKNRIENQE